MVDIYRHLPSFTYSIHGMNLNQQTSRSGGPALYKVLEKSYPKLVAMWEEAPRLPSPLSSPRDSKIEPEDDKT